MVSCFKHTLIIQSRRKSFIGIDFNPNNHNILTRYVYCRHSNWSNKTKEQQVGWNLMDEHDFNYLETIQNALNYVKRSEIAFQDGIVFSVIMLALPGRNDFSLRNEQLTDFASESWFEFRLSYKRSSSFRFANNFIKAENTSFSNLWASANSPSQQLCRGRVGNNNFSSFSVRHFCFTFSRVGSIINYVGWGESKKLLSWMGRGK